jgi:hypothetical protein
VRELKVEVAVSARAGDGAAVANWLFIEKSTKHARRSGSWRLVLCPVDPAQAGQLDVLNGLPRHGPGGPVDQFGLVVAFHRLREGVVETITDGPDRGRGTDRSETLAIPDGRKPAGFNWASANLGIRTLGVSTNETDTGVGSRDGGELLGGERPSPRRVRIGPDLVRGRGPGKDGTNVVMCEQPADC